MDPERILLASYDLTYLQHLEVKAINTFGAKIDIYSFSQPELLAERIHEIGSFSLAIVDGAMYQRFKESFESIRIAQLYVLEGTPVGNPAVHAQGEPIYFHKASGIKALFEAILYEKPATETSMQRVFPKTILLYSPAGGAGKTTLALALCAILRGMGHRALYASTEALQTHGRLMYHPEYLQNDFAKGILSAKAGLAAKLNENIDQEPVPCLRPLANSSDLEEKNIIPGILALSKEIIAQKEKDFVLLDSSSILDISKVKLMQSCDKVLIVCGQSESDAAKLEAFLGLIDVDKASRFLFVQNKYQEQLRDCTADVLKKKGAVLTFSSQTPYHPVVENRQLLELLVTDPGLCGLCRRLAYT